LSSNGKRVVADGQGVIGLTTGALTGLMDASGMSILISIQLVQQALNVAMGSGREFDYQGA